MLKWRTLLAAGVLCAVVAACSDDSSTSQESVAVGDAPAVSATSTAVTDTAVDTAVDTTVAATDAPTTEAPTTTGPAEPWETITAPADCMCSDGSGFNFFVHRADPTKVVFFLEGGGACFDATTCGPDSSVFTRAVGDSLGVSTGIFDFTNPDNPFEDWSMVYVPYCTGDAHLGDKTMDYGNGVVIQHKGAVNAGTALTAMRDLFPGLEELVVTGESAGAIPSPMYAGMAADLYPSASIEVLADGSGAYPDVPVVNSTIIANWGALDAMPPWPENEGLTVDDWSVPGIFIQAHRHAPNVVLARHDFAFDQTQQFFASLAGFPADKMVELIDQNEAQIEASGAELFSYISPGDSHTILGSPGFYTHVVNDVPLVQWVTDLVDGTPIADVHCTECTTA